MKKVIMGLTLFTALGLQAAVNGTVKDGGGQPVSGALVVVEGTDQAVVTDAAGKFQFGPLSIQSLHLSLKQLATSHILVDAQGHYYRAEDKKANKFYFHTNESNTINNTPTNLVLTTKRTVTTNGKLLIAHDGYFSQVLPIDIGSSIQIPVSLVFVNTFAQTSTLGSFSAVGQIIAFSDSIIKSIDNNSKYNPVCKGGKVIYLPDTTTEQYMITGKTMYSWTPMVMDSLDCIATVYSSNNGVKLGSWNYIGVSAIPQAHNKGACNPAQIDSQIQLENSYFFLGGVIQFSNTQIMNNVKYGLCNGALLAARFSLEGNMTATAKSCNEVELKNGTETATWSIISNNVKSTTKFITKDTTCTIESPVILDQTYSCVGQADGVKPEDTGTLGGLTTGADLFTCPAYVKFLTGGFTLPPITPLQKMSANMSVEKFSPKFWESKKP